MKYLVNNQTKEHRAYCEKLFCDLNKTLRAHSSQELLWQVIEADDEGWIPFGIGECPLREEDRCQWKTISGGSWTNGDKKGMKAKRLAWNGGQITHYRPILAEKEERIEHFTTSDEGKPIPCDDDLPRGPSVFDRLRNATEAAESIPAILAEINAMLPDGYCVTKREDEPAEDMSDWRNWKEGDLVECVNDDGWAYFLKGDVYQYRLKDEDSSHVSYAKVESFPDDFRFHSRPKK